MAAGPLRHEVIIQTRQTTQDDFGQVIATWTDGSPIWARVEPVRANEAPGQVQVQADVTHRIRMRGVHAVGVMDRIKFETRIFEVIESRNLEERGVWRELLCKEAVS